MEALFEKIVFPKTQAFLIREFHFATLWYPWHYHPELELTCILKSTGQRFVGDNIEYFEEDDLVLVGRNLPHFWRNDETYYENEKEGATHCIVLQFREDMFGTDFLEVSELEKIKKLFSKSKRGIHFTGIDAKNAISKMKKLLTLKGMDSIVELLSLLKLLSESKEARLLSTTGYIHNHGTTDLERVNKVYQYAITNFRSNANLEEAARIACLNTSAFCRFFKLRTNKTFIQFVNELKVNHASKLLKQTDMGITSICFESGFNNISNFNRQFKKTYGKTPRQLREYYN